MPKSTVYNFSTVEELQTLSIKYVEFLHTDGVIDESLYSEYSAKLALRERCSCPQCKGEYSRARELFSFQEKVWEPLWGREKSERNSEV